MRKNNQSFTRSAFTILELLISIGIIGIITSLVMIYIDPVGMFGDADTASNSANTTEFQKAIQRYAVRFGEYPPGITTDTQQICSHGQTDTGCIDLTEELASTSNSRKGFMSQIPQLSTATSPFSGYAVALNSNGVPIISVYSEAEILISSGLTNHWRFDEGAGTTVTDSVGGNNGTFVNLTTSNWSTSKPTTGLYENSFQGGPTSGYVSLDTPVSMPVNSGSQWSIAYWYYQASSNDMSLGETGQNYNRIYHQTYYRVHLDNGNYFDIRDFTPNSNLNAWHHFVLIWNGSTFEGYVDGIQRSYTNISYGGASTSFNIDAIGHAYNTNGYTWQGRLSDVRLYSRNLTPSEITSIYNGEG